LQKWLETAEFPELAGCGQRGGAVSRVSGGSPAGNLPGSTDRAGDCASRFLQWMLTGAGRVFVTDADRAPLPILPESRFVGDSFPTGRLPAVVRGGSPLPVRVLRPSAVDVAAAATHPLGIGDCAAGNGL